MNLRKFYYNLNTVKNSLIYTIVVQYLKIELLLCTDVSINLKDLPILFTFLLCAKNPIATVQSCYGQLTCVK